MKPKVRVTGADAPANLARRFEAALESGRPPRLEGRFKDAPFTGGRDRPAGGEAGDLRDTPRSEPRTVRRPVR